MRKDLLRTLFSRMLTAFMTVMLAMLLLTGITVAALLQGQAMRQRKLTVHREAESVADLYAKATTSFHTSGVETELRVIARYTDGLIQIIRANGSDESYYDDAKWEPLAKLAYSDADLRTLLLSTSEAGEEQLNRYESHVDFPVLTASRSLYEQDGSETVILFHTDVSDVNTAAYTVYIETVLVALVASLIAIIVVYFSTTLLTKPFLEINEVVQRYSKGDYNARIPISNTEEATQLAISFNAMADQLKDLEATRRSFVANVSHELRSPLTSMRGFLEAMQDGTIGPDEYDKYINIVLSETRRMTTMVNDLLDLARIESGKTALKLEIFDINELIRRTLITFEARIYEKRTEVDVKFAQDQYYVEADSAQISQVLRNLIDNALKYSPDERKLRIATYALRREVYVAIQDSGYGIPEEDIGHVFDRFYKVEKAHTPTKQSGTGLGLSIVKRIIDQHGQTITLKSAKGKGSTFTFTLKRAPAPKRIQDGGKKVG